MRTRWRPPRLLGPLFGYDLVAATRRGQHTGLRILVATLLLFTLYAVYAFRVHGYDPLADPFAPGPKIPANEMADLASQFALWCMIVQFGAVVLLTPTIVADAIAREKERRALDFLFVTQLTDREIILGKLGSRLAYLFGVLLTGLPVLSLTMFFGGVPPGLLFTGYAALISTLISLSALSMYCSVVSRTALAATIRAYAAAVAYLFICPCILFPLAHTDVAMAGMIAYVVANLGLTWILVAVSVKDLRPRAELLPPLPAVATPSASMRLAQVRQHSGDAPMVVAVAGVIETVDDDAYLPFVLPLANRRREPPGDLRQSPDTIHHPTAHAAGSPVDPVEWRNLDRPLVWEPPELPRVPLPPVDERRPLLWKEVCLHSFAGTAAARPVVGTLLGLGAGLALLLLLMMAVNPQKSGEMAEYSCGLVKVATVLLGALFGMGVMAHAVNSVTKEKERDTLDALLTLPQHRDRVLEAKWLGGPVSLWAVGISLIGVWVFGLATGGLHPVGLVCLAASMAATVEFLASLGLWLSVMCRTSLRANMAAALCLLLVGCGPWVIRAYADLLSPRGGPTPGMDAATAAAMPLVAWVEACVPWGGYAALPAGHFTTLLVAALAYATAAWVFWRAAVGRFRLYGGRPKS
jgi:ABC-type transport system involved in multi-copper enzyme maturation permease subunit